MRMKIKKISILIFGGAIIFMILSLALNKKTLEISSQSRASLSKQELKQSLPAESLADLFAVEPPAGQTQSRQPPRASRNEAEKIKLPSSLPETEKAQVVKYLTDSSELKFPKNWEVAEVIALTYKGDRGSLENLIKVFEKKMESFKKMKPPKSLENFHQKSLWLLGNYINMLKAVDKSVTPTEITNILSSKSAQEMRNQAKALILELRNFLVKENISVPKSVLPANSG